MNFELVNWPAVIVAALAMFVIGGVWYSPVLFSKAWMRTNRFTDTDLQGRNMILVFGVSFLLCLLMATNLAIFLADPKTEVVWGMMAGLLAGLGWAAFSLAVIALFEKRPAAYIFINGGYLVVGFVAMGAILGGWR
jgi:membrane-associated HD superfamily phosphohydrolase